MRLIASIRDGLFGGRGKGLVTALFWGGGFLAATFIVSPMRAGFHRVLDGSPAASDLLSGRGIDLLFELVHNQPGLWAAAFGALMLGLVAHLLVSLYLTGGAYGLWAEESARPWRDFWSKAWHNLPPFAAIFLMNVAVWLILGGIAIVPLIAVGRSLREKTDPGPAWTLFRIQLVAVLVVFNLMRNSIGFTQARYVLTGGSEGIGRSFLRGLAFTFRRFVPVNVMTWFFNLLRVGAMVLAVFTLSPGYTTAGRGALTVLLLQAGFVFAAYLRVAETRAQVAYQREFLPAPSPVIAEEALPPQPVPAAEGPIGAVTQAIPAGGE